MNRNILVKKQLLINDRYEKSVLTRLFYSLQSNFTFELQMNKINELIPRQKVAHLINLLSHKVHLNISYTFSSYLTENTVRLQYKTILVKQIIITVIFFFFCCSRFGA
jgi:hypothetical protein